MSFNISWLSELVPGAEAELKTVLSELEKVYVPKLEAFAVKAVDDVEKLVGIGSNQAPPPATPVVAPPVETPTVPTLPADPTVPVGNVVETSTGVVTDPTGATVTPDVPPPTVDPTVTPTPVATPPISDSAAAELGAMTPDQKAAVKELFNTLLGDL